MNCIKCGKQIVDGAKFCSMCGTQQQVQTQQPGNSSGKPMDGVVQRITGFLQTLKTDKKKLAIICAAAGAVVLLAVGIILAVVLTNGGSSDSGKGKNIHIQSRSKTGLMFESENKLVSASFDYLIMTDGSKKYGVMDFDGNTVISFDYESLEFLDNNVFPDLFMANKGGKCGVFNAKGKEIVELKYDFVGFSPTYERLFCIEKSSEKIVVFDIKGKKQGEINLKAEISKIGAFPRTNSGGYVVNDEVAVTVNCGISQNNQIIITGMISSDIIGISRYIDKSGYKLSFYCISSGKEVSSYISTEFNLFVENPNKEDCYYTVREADIVNRVMNNIIIDSEGQKVDKAKVKTSSGKTIAEVDNEKYFAGGNSSPNCMVKVLNDNGLCLAYNQNGQFELVNMRSGDVINRADEFCFKDSYQLVAMKDENEIRAYRSDGEQIFQLSNHQISSDEYSLIGKLINNTIGNSICENGVVLQKESESSIVFRSYSGDETKIADGKVIKTAYYFNDIAYSDLFSTVRELNLADSYIKEDSYYFLTGNNLMRTFLCNEDGKVLDELSISQLDMSDLDYFCNMHGICFRTDDGKVWWYNRKA